MKGVDLERVVRNGQAELQRSRTEVSQREQEERAKVDRKQHRAEAFAALHERNRAVHQRAHRLVQAYGQIDGYPVTRAGIILGYHETPESPWWPIGSLALSESKSGKTKWEHYQMRVFPTNSPKLREEVVRGEYYGQLHSAGLEEETTFEVSDPEGQLQASDVYVSYMTHIPTIAEHLASDRIISPIKAVRRAYHAHRIGQHLAWLEATMGLFETAAMDPALNPALASQFQAADTSSVTAAKSAA